MIVQYDGLMGIYTSQMNGFHSTNSINVTQMTDQNEMELFFFPKSNT